MLKDGDFSHIPLMIGTNQDEGQLVLWWDLMRPLTGLRYPEVQNRKRLRVVTTPFSPLPSLDPWQLLLILPPSSHRLRMLWPPPLHHQHHHHLLFKSAVPRPPSISWQDNSWANKVGQTGIFQRAPSPSSPPKWLLQNCKNPCQIFPKKMWIK